MIQTYFTLKKQIQKINEIIDENTFIQKIYSSSYFICLNLRKPGESIYLYIGRGKGFEGLWIGQLNIKSELRKKDRFLEYHRKHLSSCRLLDIELDNRDRVFAINYQKWGKINSFFYFYKGRELYFMNNFYDSSKDCMNSLKSWNSNNKDIEKFEVFDEIGRKELNKEEENQIRIISIEDLLKKEQNAVNKKSISIKKDKFNKRKEKRMLSDLKKVILRTELLSLIETEENLENLPSKVLTKNHRMSFKTKEHFKRRDEVYNKIKKLARAETILKQRIEEHNNRVNTKLSEKKLNNLSIINPVWRPIKVEQKKKQLNKNTHKELQFKNFKMALGLNSQGNDFIRKNWGTKEDWWFHIENETSAHAIIKLGSNELNQELIQIVGSAIIEHTEKDKQEVSLIYTQVKNLKGVTGKAGSVKFKKEKRITIIFDKDWRSK